jgi:hypothetical protein
MSTNGSGASIVTKSGLMNLNHNNAIIFFFSSVTLSTINPLCSSFGKNTSENIGHNRNPMDVRILFISKENQIILAVD